MKLKTTIKESVIVFVTIVLVVGVTYAGSLTPPTGTVTSQSYTLGDIYYKVSDINYSATSHTVSTTSSPSSSFYTLTDIYGKLNTAASLLIPGNIRSGVTILGVTGNYTGNSTAPTLSWTGTIPSLQVVNFVRIFQPGFGGREGLCWSHGQFEIGANQGRACVTRQVPRYPGDASGGFYEANPNVGPNGENSIPLGAVEYCDYLNSNGLTIATTPQHYWRLPTQSELHSKAFAEIMNGTDDPTTESRGGFRNLGYFSSELHDENYYPGLPPGTKDSVKMVGFFYSSNIKQTSFGKSTRDYPAVFRCVHEN